MRLLVYIVAIIFGINTTAAAQSHNSNTMTHPRRQLVAPKSEAQTRTIRTKITAEQIYSWAVYRNARAINYTKKYIDIQNQDGMTALCIAQKRNDREAYKLLLSYGANKDVDCHRDDAPLAAIKTTETIKPSTGAYIAGGVAAAALIGVAASSGGGGGSSHHGPTCEDGYSADIKDASDCKTTGSAGWRVEIKGECGKCIKKDKEGNCDTSIQSANDCGEQGSAGWEYSYNGYVGNDKCGICTPKACPTGSTTDNSCTGIDNKISHMQDTGFSGDTKCYECFYTCDTSKGYFDDKTTCDQGHGYNCEKDAASGCWINTQNENNKKTCYDGYATASADCDVLSSDGLVNSSLGEGNGAYSGQEECKKCEYSIADGYYDDKNKCQAQTGYECQETNPNDVYEVYEPTSNCAESLGYYNNPPEGHETTKHTNGCYIITGSCQKNPDSNENNYATSIQNCTGDNAENAWTLIPATPATTTTGQQITCHKCQARECPQGSSPAQSAPACDNSNSSAFKVTRESVEIYNGINTCYKDECTTTCIMSQTLTNEDIIKYTSATAPDGTQCYYVESDNECQSGYTYQSGLGKTQKDTLCQYGTYTYAQIDTFDKQGFCYKCEETGCPSGTSPNYKDKSQCPAAGDGQLLINSTEVEGYSLNNEKCYQCNYECQYENIATCQKNDNGEDGYTCQESTTTGCPTNRTANSCGSGFGIALDINNCIDDTVVATGVTSINKYSGENVCMRCVYECNEDSGYYKNPETCQQQTKTECTETTAHSDGYQTVKCYISDETKPLCDGSTTFNTDELCQQTILANGEGAFYCKQEGQCWVKDENNPIPCPDGEFAGKCAPQTGMYTYFDSTAGNYSGTSLCHVCDYLCGDGPDNTNGWSDTPCSGGNCQISSLKISETNTFTCYKDSCANDEGYYAGYDKCKSNAQEGYDCVDTDGDGCYKQKETPTCDSEQYLYFEEDCPAGFNCDASHIEGCVKPFECDSANNYAQTEDDCPGATGSKSWSFGETTELNGIECGLCTANECPTGSALNCSDYMGMQSTGTVAGYSGDQACYKCECEYSDLGAGSSCPAGQVLRHSTLGSTTCYFCSDESADEYEAQKAQVENANTIAEDETTFNNSNSDFLGVSDDEGKITINAYANVDASTSTKSITINQDNNINNSDSKPTSVVAGIYAGNVEAFNAKAQAKSSTADGKITINLLEGTTQDNTAIGIYTDSNAYNAFADGEYAKATATGNIIINDNNSASNNTIYGILAKGNAYNSYATHVTNATGNIKIKSNTSKAIYGIYSQGDIYNAYTDVNGYYGGFDAIANIYIESTGNASSIYGLYANYSIETDEDGNQTRIYHSAINARQKNINKADGTITINNDGQNTNIYGIYATGDAYNGKNITSDEANYLKAKIDITTNSGKDTTVAGLYSSYGSVYNEVSDTNNSDSINNNIITITGSGSANHFGMLTNATSGGQAINQGTIDITTTDGNYAYATGAQSNSTIGGLASNSGVITIDISNGQAWGLVAGSTTNYGTITLTNQSGSVTGMDGGFTNSGTVDVETSSGSAIGANGNGTNYKTIEVTSQSGNAKGIVGTQLGDIKNEGEDASITVSGTTGQISGIYVSGTNTDSERKQITNSGNIDVSTSSTDTSTSSNALYGIYTDTMNYSSTNNEVQNVYNQGDITVTNSNADNNFSVYGIYRGEDDYLVEGNSSRIGHVHNSSNITVTNKSNYSSSIYTTGINTEGHVYNFENGTITVNATRGKASGINNNSNKDYTYMQNKGKIIVNFTGQNTLSGNNAYGISTSGNITNNIVNSGDITLTTHDAISSGIDTFTTLSNSGSITVNATYSDSELTDNVAFGVSGGNITNEYNGEISVKAGSGNAIGTNRTGVLNLGTIKSETAVLGTAYGTYYGNSVNNSGIIQAKTTGSGDAYGTYNSTVTNSAQGNISATTNSGTAHGVQGSVTNVGTISATSSLGDAYGVFGSATNSGGIIQATTNGSGDARGVSGVGATLTNDGGTIIATANGSGTATGFLGQNVVDNYGTIEANATTGTASAVMVDYDNNEAAAFYGSTINANTTGEGSATGIFATYGDIYTDAETSINISSPSGARYGIFHEESAEDDTDIDDIINEGEIYLNDDESSTGLAIGIYSNYAEVLNDGKIDIYQSGSSYGIDNWYGNTTNTGEINVTSTNDWAYGIKSDTGNITNGSNDNSNSKVYVSSVNGDAYGIYSKSGNITNYGNVYVSSVNGDAYGIYVDDALSDQDGNNNPTTITNSGLLRVGSVSGNAYGIYLNAGTAKIINTGTIELYNNSELYPSGFHNNFIYVNEGANAEKTGCDDEHCKILSTMPTTQATVLNSGTVKFGNNVDINTLNTELVLEEGGTYEAQSFSGDINVGTSVVSEGQEDTYVAENAIVAEDVSELSLKSKSAMFNTELQQNDSGNYDAVATRRDFQEFAPNESIANYLEQNYQAGNLNNLYSELKTLSSDADVTKDIVHKTGAEFLINLPQENLNAIRDTTEVIADAILTPTEEQYRISSGAHVFYQESDNHGLASGYENTMSSAYMYGDKRINNNNRLGLGLAFMQMDSSYDMGANRDENFVTVFVPWLHKFNNNLRLTSILTAGYGYGDYERGSNEADINDYIYGITNKLVYNVNLADYAELEPALIFNVLGYYQDEMDDDEIVVKAENHLSAEVGAGLFLKKELMNDKYGKLTARIGGVYYHELADPYNKMRAGFKGGVGSYEIDDFANIYSRDRAVLSAMLDYNYKKVGVYAKYHHLLQKNDAKNFDLGIKYNF